jgi:hypothetical protein
MLESKFRKAPRAGNGLEVYKGILSSSFFFSRDSGLTAGRHEECIFLSARTFIGFALPTLCPIAGNEAGSFGVQICRAGQDPGSPSPDPSPDSGRSHVFGYKTKLQKAVFELEKKDFLMRLQKD